MDSPTDITDTTAWQLAHKLNLRVDLFLLSPDFRRNFRHVDRLSDAVRRGPDYIVMGAACDRVGFAHRVRLAKGSQAEVLAHLRDAHHQGLITLDELEIARRLAHRAMNAATGLIRSLEATGEYVATPARRRTRLRSRSIPTGLD